MLRFRFAALAAVAVLGFASVASAADLPRKAPAYTPPPPPVFSWTGFYVGGTVGAAWSKSDVTLNTVDGPLCLYCVPGVLAGLNALGSNDLTNTNVIAGGKIGYNQQWNSLVFGLEADFSYFPGRQSVFTSGHPFVSIFPIDVANFNESVKTGWLATIRPRIGYAFDRALLYATGGVAFSDVKFSAAYFGHSPLGSGNEGGTASSDDVKTGWTVGGGFDYALTNNWIINVEYLHVDLGTIDAGALVTTNSTSTATMNFSTKLRSDIVRGGISYKFW